MSRLWCRSSGISVILRRPLSFLLRCVLNHSSLNYQQINFLIYRCSVRWVSRRTADEPLTYSLSVHHMSSTGIQRFPVFHSDTDSKSIASGRCSDSVVHKRTLSCDSSAVPIPMVSASDSHNRWASVRSLHKTRGWPSRQQSLRLPSLLSRNHIKVEWLIISVFQLLIYWVDLLQNHPLHYL